MNTELKRRNFLKVLLGSPFIASGGFTTSQGQLQLQQTRHAGPKLKISLNAYSFNDPLTKGTLTLPALLDFCAASNFDAVDLTGYYFPGYPAVPTDEYLFHLKQKAFRLGLNISGTGVRNDFSTPDTTKRNHDVEMVKQWIECAAKMGAPVIRIFSGTQVPEGHTWEETATWIVTAIRECVAYGKKSGVIVAMQNHNDFIKNADQALKIISMVNSEWFGLVLDIGSFTSGDPYRQIEQTAPYAVNWQLKENMFVNSVEQKTDLRKIMAIIKSSGYQGYLPIETLGAGDPFQKCRFFWLRSGRRWEMGEVLHIAF